MTKIDSKKAEIPAPAKDVFEFLCDMNNIEKLLPEGKYSKFKSDGKSCSFTMSSYSIELTYASSEPYTQVRYESAQGSPIRFNLVAHLEENGNLTIAQLKSEAQVNPFVEMMIKAPLNSLFDHMSGKLVTQFKSA